MLLRDLMWEIFQSTGHVEAYLRYRSCTENHDQTIASLDHIERIAPLN